MRTVFPDASFRKYAQSGAYHWREIGRGPISHNAFTAERYRRVIEVAVVRGGDRVLDYGCGDGALLGMLHRRMRGAAIELHGFDPNPIARDLAKAMLASRGIGVTLHESVAALSNESFDRIVCAEVIEHASDPEGLIKEIARLLRNGGRAIFTTPIRMTESPEDPNHVREWFAGEFLELFARSALRVLEHHQTVPVAAPEVYFWRPLMFARVPVFRLVCNLLSSYGGINAMSWLRMRPRLFMTQIVVAERRNPLVERDPRHEAASPLAVS